MEILKEAYETIDGKVFKDKEEAETHEHNLLIKKEVAKLLHRCYGYNGMIEDLYFVAENLIKNKDKLLNILGE